MSGLDRGGAAPEALVMRGATWRYPTAAAPAIGPIELAIPAGQLVLLTGPTGCGKSTLLRLAAGLAARHGEGEAAGLLRVCGEDPATLPAGRRPGVVGFVAQDPGDQLVTGTLGDEVALAAGAAGRPIDPAALRALLAAVGLDLPLERPVTALSGGQRQRLVVAAALSAGARLLLLDEPLAWLDPPGAAELMRALRRLADSGVAVLIVEHRVEAAAAVADRVLLMAEGRIVSDRPASNLDEGAMERLGVEVPGRMVPTVPSPSPSRAAPGEPARPPGEILLERRDLRWSWPGHRVLDGAALTLRRGERVALLGPNGSGKSTLIALLIGRLGPGSGVPSEERSPGRPLRILEVPQDPDLSLFCARVWDELAYGPFEHGLRGEALAARVREAALALGVEALLDRPPQSLSRGQRLRVAVAAALALRPDLLLLDEPTAGQDRGQIDRMFQGIPPEVTVLFATHDLRLAGEHATRVLGLRAGKLEEGVPAGFGSGVEGSSPLPGATGRASAPGQEAPLLSPPQELDPRVRLALLAAAGVLALVLERALSLGILAALSLAAVLALRPGARRIRQGAVAVLAVVWSTTLSQGLFYADLPRVPLLVLGPVVVWREGVLHGLVQSMRFVALTLGGLAVAVSTPPDRMLAALLALRLPYALAFLAATGLRFVPVIAEEWLIVRRARAARGRPTWRRLPWDWLRLELDLLRPVVARALRRARVLGESLDARGFDPASPPPLRRPLRLRLGEWMGLGVLGGATIAAVAARLLFVAYSSEALYVVSLRPLYGWVRGWL